MTVGAVIVHFRFWPEIDQTLRALLDQTRPPDHVVVVDDRSGDGSVERLREAYPQLDVMVAPSNRGVIANFNAGIELMRDRGAEAMLMLTHETVLEPDALEVLGRRLSDDPAVGMAGPLLGFLSRPDVVFSAGGELLARTWQNPHVAMYEPLDAWRGTGPAEVPWLDGACVLVRTEALERCGPLPERYFHYYDDVELGVRIARAGWRVECHRDAVARQEPGSLAEYYRVRNRLGFLAAQAPRALVAREAMRHLRQAVRDARGGDPDGRALAADGLRGVRDFLLGRWGRRDRGLAGVKRRDHATGGALDGPCPASWALPPDRLGAGAPS